MKTVSVKKSLIILCVILSSLILLWDLGSMITQFHSGKKEVCLTVFVHGSVYTMLSALDAKRIWSGKLSQGSPYIDMVKRVRKNPLIFQDQIMLQEGWIPFPQTYIDNFFLNKLHKDHCQRAAHQFIPVYEALSEEYANNQEERIYFLFGHLGLLCQEYRANIGAQLYSHLYETIFQLQKKYWRVRTTIVAHSHGGNIVLNLSRAENLYKRNIHIDNLVLYGTPIQVETASYAYASIFERVINCYSDGDTIQANDRFSTIRHTSHKRLYDDQLIIERPDTQTKIYDIRLQVNGNSQRIGHSNMWQLGRESKATECLDPLPIAVLTPLLLDQLDKQLYDGQFDFNIIEKKDLLQVQLSLHQNKTPITVSDNFYSKACELQQLTKNNWTPVDKSRMLLFNYQTGATLWKAFQDWRTGVDIESIE